jgi:hypothetical protein
MANSLELLPMTNSRDASQYADESDRLTGSDLNSLHKQSYDKKEELAPGFWSSDSTKLWVADGGGGGANKRSSTRPWTKCVAAALVLGVIGMVFVSWSSSSSPAAGAGTSDPAQSPEDKHAEVTASAPILRTTPPRPTCCSDQSCKDLASLSPTCTHLVANTAVVENGGCNIEMSLLGQEAGSGRLGDAAWCPISCNVCAGTDFGAVAATITLDRDISGIRAGTAERKDFRAEFTSDVATALGVEEDRVGCAFPSARAYSQRHALQQLLYQRTLHKGSSIILSHFLTAAQVVITDITAASIRVTFHVLADATGNPISKSVLHSSLARGVSIASGTVQILTQISSTDGSEVATEPVPVEPEPVSELQPEPGPEPGPRTGTGPGPGPGPEEGGQEEGP